MSDALDDALRLIYERTGQAAIVVACTSDGNVSVNSSISEESARMVLGEVVEALEVGTLTLEKRWKV